MDNNNKKEIIENAKKVAGKMYSVSDYESKEELDKGIAITHEQVSDNYMEGTIDGKIDRVNRDGELETHDGKSLRSEGFE